MKGLCRGSFVFAAVALLACAHGGATAPAARLGATARSVVVLPLNVALTLPAELEGSEGRVWNVLVRYVQAHGKKVRTVRLVDARRLWLDSIRLTTEEAAQTAEGTDETPEVDFDAVARTFVRELGRDGEFDAVIMPSLFLQHARLSTHRARWDGVSREVDIEGDVQRVGRITTSTYLTGTTPAASLHVVILDADGANLHEAQAGLALLQYIVVGGERGAAVTDRSVSWEPRPDPFENEEDVREGIERALDPFLVPLPE